MHIFSLANVPHQLRPVTYARKVRSTPESGHLQCNRPCPLGAKGGSHFKVCWAGKLVCYKPFVMERSESNFLSQACVFANASEAIIVRYNTGGGAQIRI
jgi:hypothetical protein